VDYAMAELQGASWPAEYGEEKRNWFGVPGWAEAELVQVERDAKGSLEE